jgi:hypothetical protein
MTSAAPQTSTVPPAEAEFGWLRLLAVGGIALFLVWAVYQHLFSLNSTHYFEWDWRHLPGAEVYPVMALAIPLFAAQWMHRSRPGAVVMPVTLLILSNFALMLGFLYVQETPHTWLRIAELIESPMDNGYFKQAVQLLNNHHSVSDVLRNYPQYLPDAAGHSYNKPPGLVVFHMMLLKTIGVNYTASEAAGFLLAGLASLCVGAVYAFIKYFTADREAAFCGASFFALCPAPLLYFPQFDQCYPLFTAALAIGWALAIRKDRAALSLAFGTAFAATLFVTYLPAALVIFFAGTALLQWRGEKEKRGWRIVMHLAIAVGGFALFYVALWRATGFDPIASFLTAGYEEKLALFWYYKGGHHVHRTMPGMIPWNLYNFAVGSGWISYLLVMFYFVGDCRWRRRSLPIVMLCLAQILVVGISGLIGPETWRLWIFMMPMLMAPVGLELSRWKFGPRIAVYFLMLVLTTVICQSMQFML